MPAVAQKARQVEPDVTDLCPIEDRVIIEPLERQEKTPGGIIIPDKTQERQERGIAVAVGPGRVLESGSIHRTRVAVGDGVIFGRYAGQEVEVGGKKFNVLRETDLIAYISGGWPAE